MSKWCVKKCSVSPDELMDFYGTGKPLAYALYNRKIRNKREIEKYINSDDYPFENIRNLKGVNEAFFLIKDAVDEEKKIYIYGDYDADGVMSTSIMYKGLKGLGADVHYFIPNRVEDGYGLNEKAVRKLIDEGAEFIITCDNGISAHRQIDIAVGAGVKVVVLDHHEPPFEMEKGVKRDIIPNADAVVDAKLQNCGYLFTQMCAGGLCYRFICGLYDYMGVELKNKNELMELAAVATICDVVDLTGENRAIASKGISLMNEGSSNLGLRTLIELKDIETVTSYNIGFVIGPCINASGRLDSAKIAVELFTTDSAVRIKELASALNEFNEKRKTITFECFDRIVEKIESSSFINDKIIVVYDEDTHESVAGIIAGRLREKYDRPAIVLTKGEDGVKGSGRSVENYDMFKGLYEVKNILSKFGGHTMAAGLSLEKENIDLFRKTINDNCKMAIEDLESVLRAEAILDLGDITVESADELKILSPFGKANEKPLYGIKNVEAVDIRFVGSEGNIVSFVVTDGKKRIKAVDFNNYNLWIEAIKRAGFDCEYLDEAIIGFSGMFNLDVNIYKEYVNPQIIIRDIRFN